MKTSIMDFTDEEIINEANRVLNPDNWYVDTAIQFYSNNSAEFITATPQGLSSITRVTYVVLYGYLFALEPYAGTISR